MNIAPVNKIIPFSAVDGPGNRAAVFLQGCGYTCNYCHNPETLQVCANCGDCISDCPVGALSIIDERVNWNTRACIHCDACINVCKRSSSPKVKYMTAESVYEELSEAMPFITGITTSGGECTLYDGFLCELFELAKKKGLSSMVDTNGQRSFKQMPELLKIVDAVSLDVKTTNAKEHMALTGMPVNTVLENLELLGKARKLYEVRTVIVPNKLDNHSTVRDVAKMLAQFPDVRYKLIRFRNYGVRGDWANLPSPDDELMNELALLAKSNGCAEVVLL